MKTLDLRKVEYYKNNKFKFDLGKYFNLSFELFQKNWQPFVIYSLVGAGIFIISYFTLIGLLLVIFPLTIGFLIGAERADSGMRLELADFFGGFKHLGNYFVFIIMTTILSLIVLSPYIFLNLIPFIFSQDQSSISEGFLIGSVFLSIIYMLFAILVLFVFQACMFLTPYLIHYGNMGAIDAMKTSYAIVKKNFWWFLLFSIITGLVSSMGMFACYIGAVATYPIGYIMVYYMLKDMLLTDDNKTEIDMLGTNQE